MLARQPHDAKRARDTMVPFTSASGRETSTALERTERHG